MNKFVGKLRVGSRRSGTTGFAYVDRKTPVIGGDSRATTHAEFGNYKFGPFYCDPVKKVTRVSDYLTSTFAGSVNHSSKHKQWLSDMVTQDKNLSLKKLAMLSYTRSLPLDPLDYPSWIESLTVDCRKEVLKPMLYQKFVLSGKTPILTHECQFYERYQIADIGSGGPFASQCLLPALHLLRSQKFTNTMRDDLNETAHLGAMIGDYYRSGGIASTYTFDYHEAEWILRSASAEQLLQKKLPGVCPKTVFPELLHEDLGGQMIWSHRLDILNDRIPDSLKKWATKKKPSP